MTRRLLSLPSDVAPLIHLAVPCAKVVDLSADFRLRDVETYAKWYGGAHKAPELQEEAVYGLTEIFREQVDTHFTFFLMRTPFTVGAIDHTCYKLGV
jgi:N-acetyl-gamma-glutamylphosphate reductase